MHTTSILFHRGRSGTSTILGTLIFVGIMFTAVIPMLLVMRQADTLHELRRHELGLLDEERRIEDISFYAYILEEDPGPSNEIYVKIENRGEDMVKIVRVWINDVNYPLDANIKSMGTKVLGPFTVVLESLTSYTVKVVTEKGNSFSSEAGTLFYSEGGWYTPSLGICVHIDNFRGKYQIIIKTDTNPETVPLHQYESPRIEHGEIEKTFWVDDPGSYYVTIKKDGAGGWENVDPIYVDFPVDVVWPGPKPITDVYASGI